jgi:hypothetical protein
VSPHGGYLCESGFARLMPHQSAVAIVKLVCILVIAIGIAYSNGWVAHAQKLAISSAR